MFNILKTDIEGCLVLQPKNLEDYRGSFIKIFHKDFFEENNLRTDFKEEYYSISKHNVFRGLHFQYPPKDHAKLVTCLSGSVIDIIVDLRKESSTYKKIFSIELNEDNKNIFYLPSGIAHGFLVTSKKDALMLYNVTSVFSKEHDGGINFEYIKKYLPPIEKLIISQRDKQLPKINEIYINSNTIN